MTSRTRTVVTILAVLAAVTMLIATAYNGYLSLTRPPVVITNAPVSAVLPADSASADRSSADISAPVATTKPHSSRSASHTHKKRSGSKHSGKIDKLTDPSQGSVDINTAGTDDLQRLPGVGPAMAERIMSARSNDGGFRTVHDLLNVRGIGPKKFAKMEPFVRT